jgi:hypothetical protein
MKKKAKFYTIPIPEEKITLSEMFEFIEWKDNNEYRRADDGKYYQLEQNIWGHSGEILVAESDIEMWNKFKEREI